MLFSGILPYKHSGLLTAEHTAMANKKGLSLDIFWWKPISCYCCKIDCKLLLLFKKRSQLKSAGFFLNINFDRHKIYGKLLHYFCIVYCSQEYCQMEEAWSRTVDLRARIISSYYYNWPVLLLKLATYCSAKYVWNHQSWSIRFLSSCSKYPKLRWRYTSVTIWFRIWNLWQW